MQERSLLVFDFDGVIVDGMAEYWWSARHAAQSLDAASGADPQNPRQQRSPSAFRQLPEALGASRLGNGSCRLRSCRGSRPWRPGSRPIRRRAASERAAASRGVDGSPPAAGGAGCRARCRGRSPATAPAWLRPATNPSQACRSACAFLEVRRVCRLGGADHQERDLHRRASR